MELVTNNNDLTNKSTCKQSSVLREVLATFVASLSVMSCGLHYAWPSPSLPKLLSENSDLQIDGGEGSWLAITPFMGGIIGALIGMEIVDRIGRRYAILLTAPMYFLSWILIAFISNYWVAFGSRVFAGLSDGITYTTVPIYIGEIASAKIRGILGTCLTIVLITAQLFMNLVGSFVSIKTMALIAAAVPLIQLILYQFIVESPYYLLMKCDEAKAKICLQYLRHLDNVDEELQAIKEAVKRQMSESSSVKDLILIPSNRKALFICMGLRGAQQLSGISAIIFYIQLIFTSTINWISPVMFTAIFFSLQLIATIASTLLIDRYGRKLLFILSSIGCTISIAIVTIYFYYEHFGENQISFWVLTVSLYVYIVTYSFGMSPIPIAIVTEVFPSNVKAKAVAFMDIYFSIIVIIVTKLYQFLNDTYGNYVPFTMFTIFCFISVLFAIFYLPETKGKTLEEIQILLQTKSIRKNKKILNLRKLFL